MVQAKLRFLSFEKYLAYDDGSDQMYELFNVQRDRAYIAKRAQYQDIGIPEYWIVDPQLQVVTVLEMTAAGDREVGVFQNAQSIISPSFPDLALTPQQILV